VGHGKEKRGSSGAKAALLMPLHESSKKSVAPHKRSSTKKPQAPGRERPTRSILWRSRWPARGKNHWWKPQTSSPVVISWVPISDIEGSPTLSIEALTLYT